MKSEKEINEKIGLIKDQKAYRIDPLTAHFHRTIIITLEWVLDEKKIEG